MNNEADKICKWCGGLKSLRFPASGQCDHLYWPDYLTPVQKKANGIVETRATYREGHGDENEF
jgi:hypothetical protein